MSDSYKYKKHRKYKSEVIYPHKHCPVCDGMMPEEETEYGEFCSAECAGEKGEKKKKNRKRILFMFGGYAIMIAVFIILSFVL